MSNLLLFIISVAPILVQAQPQREAAYHPITSKITSTVSSKGHSTKLHEIKNKVLSEAGATEMSTYPVTLTDPSEKFRLIRAEVSTDGKVYSTPAAEVSMAKRPLAEFGLREVFQHVIPLKQVRVGSEVTIVYELKTEPMVPGIYGDAMGISNKELADVEVYKFISGLPLNFLGENLEPYYAVKKYKQDESHIIEVTPTPIARQMVGKEEKVGVFMVSSAHSWFFINKSVHPKYEAATAEKLPPKFAQIVLEAKKEKTEKAKIDLVAKKLKAIVTYSGNWTTNDGKFFPSGHDKVLTLGKGDCKDYSTSMAAMLRQLGFTSHVALSFRRQPGAKQSTIEKGFNFPSIQTFNHAIVYAKSSSGQEWWIDPTNPLVNAGIISGDLLGNFALVLDGKSDNVVYLPAKNAEPSRLTLQQTIIPQTDDSAQISATLNMNPSSYNSLSMIEQQAGREVMKKVLGRVMTMQHENVTVDYEVTPHPSAPQYKVKANVQKMVHSEPLKYTQIFVPHPVFMAPISSELPEADFGPPSEVKYISLVKGKNAVDPVDHHCVVRSDWLDFDRKVVNKGEDLEVTDWMTVKKRFASQEETKSDWYKMLMGDIQSCYQVSAIVTYSNPVQKTVKDLEIDKLKGPAIEQMTEKDMEWIEDQPTNLAVRNYHHMKLYQYHQLRLSKNPNDLVSYAKASISLKNMGYFNGDKYGPGYLNASMELLNAGFAAAKGKPTAKLLATRAELYATTGKLAEANRDFAELTKLESNTFATAYAGYFLNKASKNTPAAEKWLQYGLKVATKDKERSHARDRLARIYLDQKRYEEALKVYDDLLTDKNSNPWGWHNAAIVHLEMGNLDKCIEYEKTALAISDFGAAKHTLVRALVAKAKKTPRIIGVPGGKLPPNLPDPDELLLEALKWDPESVEALAEISIANAMKFMTSKDMDAYQKGKSYLDRAVAIDPTNRNIQIPMAMYKEIEANLAKGQGRNPSSAK